MSKKNIGNNYQLKAVTLFKSYLTTFVFISLQFDSDKFKQSWLLMIICRFIKIHSDKSFFIPEYLIQIISIFISNNDIKLFSEMSHLYQNWIKYLGCIWRNLLKRWVHNPLELRPISSLFVLYSCYSGVTYESFVIDQNTHLAYTIRILVSFVRSLKRYIRAVSFEMKMLS